MGSFPHDRLPPLKENEKAIINTDASGSPGEHWMAVTQAGGKLYGYDSFGRRIDTLVPAMAPAQSVSNDTADKEQADAEQNCGARCLAWLYAVDRLGLQKAMLI